MLNTGVEDLLESVSDAFVALDNDWRYVYVNRRAGEMFGRAPEDLVGRHIWTEFPEGVGQSFYHAYHRALAEQRFTTLEDYYPPWDRWFENRIHPSREGLLIFFHDITDRKRAELALEREVERRSSLERRLRHEQSRLRALVDGAASAVYVRDLEGRFLVVNEAVARFFGRPAHEIEGLVSYDMLPDPVADAMRRLDREVIERGAHVTREVEVPHDGRLLTYMIQAFPLPAPDGALREIGGVATDITERVRTEAVLRAQKRQLREAQRLGGLGSFQRDIAGGWFEISPEFLQLFGFDPDGVEPTAEELMARVHPDDRARVVRDAEQAVARGGRYTDTYRVIMPDGEVRLLTTSNDAQRDASGRVTRIVGVARDITDERRREEELRERERQLTEAQRVGRVGSFEFDLAADRLDCSDELLRMFRLDRDAMVPNLETFLAVIHPDDRHLAVEAVEGAVRSGGGPFQVTYRLRYPDGESRVLANTGEALTDDTGAVTRLVGVTRDITVEHRQQEDLRERERQLAEAQSIGHIGSFERDFVTDRDSWSDELCRIYGLDPETVVPSLDLFGDLLHPDDRDETLRVVRAASGAGGGFRVTPRIVRPDGEVRHLSTWGRVLTDDAGQPLRLVGVSQDVTERHEAEVRRSRLNERLDLLHAIDLAILDAGTSEDIARAALARMVALLPAAAAKVVVDDDAGAQVLASEPPGSVVLGHVRWASRIEAPLTTDAGVTGRLVLVSMVPDAFDDEHRSIVTEVGAQLAIAITQSRLRERVEAHARELEERVAERTRELEEANADLESFSYSVAHDLRAPLRALQGLSQALAEDYEDVLDETGRDYCGRIVRAADRMDMLIQDLLAYARLSRSEPRMGWVALDAVINEVLAQLDGEVVRCGARVNVARPLPDVTGHAATLVQVVSNLVSNALTFTPSGVTPVVSIAATRADGTVRLTVRDNGIGIDPTHHDRVFRIFERLHGSESYPGTGIGLAIVRRGMERMQGRVGVESPSEGGSVFWIELPAAEEGA